MVVSAVVSVVLIFAACGSEFHAADGDGDAGAAGLSSDGGASSGASAGGTAGAAGGSGSDEGGAAGTTASGGSSPSGGSSGAGGTGAESGPCASAVVTGTSHACALRGDGTVWCWGTNESGQLGLGMTGVPHPEPAQVTTVNDPPPAGGRHRLGRVTKLAAANHHTCALEEDGDLYCWGANDRYGLGDGTQDGLPLPKRILSGVSDVATGSAHVCAIADGKALCWGLSTSGQAGVPANACTQAQANNCNLLPTEIAGITGIPVSLTAGAVTGCARLEDGETMCWGSNSLHALGYDADTDAHSSAVPVNMFGSGVADVVLGAGRACVRKTDGSIWCLGASMSGALGLGSVLEAPTSQRVTGFDADARELVLADQTTCAIDTDDTLWCWGRNHAGQLGTDGGETCASNESCVTTPRPLPGAAAVARVSPATQNTCLVRTDGAVHCLGENDQGQLGNGSYADSSTPLAVSLPCSSGCHPIWGFCETQTRDSCQTVPGCSYEVGACSGTALACGAAGGCQAGCIWDNTNCLGNPTPCDAIGGDACMGHGCQWSDGECSGTPPGCGFTDQVECQSHRGCYWTFVSGNNSFCSGTPTPCDYFGATACGEQPGCLWDVTGCKGEPTGCDALTPDECDARSECAWN